MKQLERGVTVWLTGLSGAGKTTIASALAGDLQRRGRRVEVLDGDVVRENLSRGLSKEDRDANIRRIGFVAELLTRNGVFVLVAAISPYRAVRDEVRARIGDFVEVFVDCSLEELLRRDVKGLYARAAAGEIKNFNVISDPYEPPLEPEVSLNTAVETPAESVAAVFRILHAHGYLEKDEARATTWSDQLSQRSQLRSVEDSRPVTADAPTIAPHGGVLQVRLASGDRRQELTGEAPQLRSLQLDPWALSDLELLAGGGLSPLTGFMREADVLSVCERLRLSDGMVWSLPILLPAEESDARLLRPNQRVTLRMAGEPLAVLTVSEMFAYDRRRMAREVYGTEDENHPGVARLLRQSGFAVAGPVEVIRIPRGNFSEYRLLPGETRALFVTKGWRTIVGFQTRNPVHRAHEYLQKVALEQVDGLLLHPLVGETKDEDIPADTRMQCYRALMDHYYPRDRVILAVFPASMRYAGPREAIFHALIRKNYGCTHFIVGRDHAGVGSYYGTYEAQSIFDQFAAVEIGVQILKFDHAFYCRACEQMATARTCPHEPSEWIVLSGSKVRNLLRAGESLPIEFSRPEVAEILRQAEAERAEAGQSDAAVRR
jgi:sulfate adenylyltransferase/3'-phosphoadenosine 5'-phosphosulfate synthase